MSVFDSLYSKVFTRLVGRVFDMAAEQQMTVIFLTRDANGMVQVVSNEDRAEAVADLISEAMIRIVQAARDEEEARNATKN